MPKAAPWLLWSLLVMPAACKKPASSATSGAACQTKVGLCAALRSGKSVGCSATALGSCPSANKVGVCQLLPDDPDGTILTYYKDFAGDPKQDCIDGQKQFKPTYTAVSG